MPFVMTIIYITKQRKSISETNFYSKDIKISSDISTNYPIVVDSPIVTSGPIIAPDPT